LRFIPRHNRKRDIPSWTIELVVQLSENPGFFAPSVMTKDGVWVKLEQAE